jgi:hypothetical protein
MNQLFRASILTLFTCVSASPQQTHRCRDESIAAKSASQAGWVDSPADRPCPETDLLEHSIVATHIETVAEVLLQAEVEESSAPYTQPAISGSS